MAAGAGRDQTADAVNPVIKITVYRDGRKEWRWRARTRNGRIVAEGGEGYKRRAALLSSLRSFMKVIRAQETVIADEE